MSINCCGVQPRPGTYALLLSSATYTVIRVGRLGKLRPPAGLRRVAYAPDGDLPSCSPPLPLAHYMLRLEIRQHRRASD